MAALLFPELIFNDNTTGSPLAAGTIETYVAGTSTPLATYTDSGGLTSVGTTITLDANGRPNSGNGIWLGSTSIYKFIIKDSDGNTVQTIDNIAAGGFSGSSTFVTTAADAGLTNARVLTGSTSITLTDNGAGSTIVPTRAALTGDVTASANSNATTIASNAVTTSKILDANVTLAKMANITTDSLIGRDTASTGVPEVITLGASLSMTGAQVLQRAALTGDVTASANSNATTIANDAVTFAKMQNIATDSLIGRDTAATGDPENILLGPGLQMDGSANLRTAYVTNSQTGTTYTALAADRSKHLIFTTQATATLMLTAAATLGDGWYCYVTNGNSALLTIDPNGAETINGSTTTGLFSEATCLIICNGSSFRSFAMPKQTITGYDYQGSGFFYGGAGASNVSMGVATIYTLATPKPQVLTLSSNANDMATLASLVELGATAAWDLTGVVPLSVTGQHLFIMNISSYTITLKHESASSTAANRFTLSTGADIALLAGQTMHFIYRVSSSRWYNVI